MKIKRILSAALATAMALTSFAFAAEEPSAKTERTITTANGTGYTVSRVGKNVIDVSDSSQSFTFTPAEGYELDRVTISDGQFTDYALASKQENELTLNGVAYPVSYATRSDAGGVSVISATIAIPAAEDDVTLGATANKAECTITVSAGSGVTVSNSTVKLSKGQSYSCTVKPSNDLCRVSSATVTAGGNSTTVSLADSTNYSTQGFGFSTNASGVLTISNPSVSATASISLRVSERKPTDNEAVIAASVDSGVSADLTKTYVRKGTDQTVSFTARRGYQIDSLVLTANGRTAYATPSSTMVFVGENAYRITGNESACTVYLTDVRSDISIKAASTYDSDNLLVETSAGTGVRITKDCGSTVSAGTDIEFEIEVTDDERYKLDDITLRVGSSSKTVSADASEIRVGGTTYEMKTDKYGMVTLYVDNVNDPIRVSATAVRTNNSAGYHNITMKSASYLSISKNINGSTIRDGNDVKFTIKPSSGHEVEDITLKIGSKSATAYASASYIRVGNEKYDIKKDSKGIVTVLVTDVWDDLTISATSVKEGHATLVGENGSNGTVRLDQTVKEPLFIGYLGGRFQPENNLTRAEAVVLLARMSNASEQADKYNPTNFNDVPSNAWYRNELAAFVSGGIVDDDTHLFRPDSAITRAEFVEMVYRLDTTEKHTSYQRFSDTSTSASYSDAVSYCTAKGWVNGYPDGTFRPYNYIARAEVAKVVNRAMGRTMRSTDFSNVTYFDDVPLHYWAYDDILIASNYQY